MTPINQLQNDKHKLSTSSMKTLLKRIDSVATAHQSLPGRMLTPAFGGSASTQINTSSTHMTDASSTKHGFPTATASVVPLFDPNGLQQVQQCSGLLSTELKMVNDALDSDATASSSGGESADELIAYNNVIQKPLTM